MENLGSVISAFDTKMSLTTELLLREDKKFTKIKDIKNMIIIKVIIKKYFLFNESKKFNLTC